METLRVKLIGTRPLMMHSDRFSNPLDAMAKAHKQLTSKRKKTDEDHEAIAQSEWRGSLYYDENLGPYIPGVNIESAIVEGGKISKLGKTLKRSAEVINDKCRLEYDGPRTPEKLWDKGFYDARSVKVQQSRLMRYRPIFYGWWLECDLMFDPDTINRSELLKSLGDAGAYCGIGDYRPKFGRFDVEEVR